MATMQNQTVSYILKNKSLVQEHMHTHATTWGPSLPPSQEDSLVKVFIRPRPLLPVDHAVKAYSLISVQPSRAMHFTHPTVRSAGGRFATKTFQADGVFGEEATNDEVCEALQITRLLDECVAIRGTDTSILAYGQTGTGKTFTTTAIEAFTISHIFSMETAMQISISALEIRGSASYDLLSDPPLAPLKIQTSGAGDIVHGGLSVHEVGSREEASLLVNRAKALRMTRSTEKNSTSSRSHSVLSIRIRLPGDSEESSRTSTFSVVDLAGSERSHHMIQNNAERVKEAIETNKSLAVLKDCIRSRLDPKIKHAPWRGSKLTMVLKTAFQTPSQTATSNRRSKLVILACVSPSPLDTEDTLNTLRYVAVFQLSAKDFEGGLEVKGRMGPGGGLSDDATRWDHDESVAYVSRNFTKLAPVVHRLLPSPESTISDLFGLSSAELRKLCGTPSEAGDRAPEARAIAQANSWIDVYHRKIEELARRSGTSQPTNEGRSTASKALDALNGRDTKADETGIVTRVDWSGRTRCE